MIFLLGFNGGLDGLCEKYDLLLLDWTLSGQMEKKSINVCYSMYF